MRIVREKNWKTKMIKLMFFFTSPVMNVAFIKDRGIVINTDESRNSVKFLVIFINKKLNCQSFSLHHDLPTMFIL